MGEPAGFAMCDRMDVQDDIVVFVEQKVLITLNRSFTS